MASNGGAQQGRLAAWTRRRPEPRLWITVAGTGCVLAVLGVILISGDARAPSDGDEGSNLPGILLCLAVVAAGFVLMHFFRERPASTAGVTAVVLGLPALMFFLTFDEESAPPVSLEAILGGSALVWLIAYLVGPGAGRPILLGVALLFGWLFAVQVVEDPFQNGIEPPAIVEEDPLGVDTGDETSGDPFEDEFDEEFGGDAFEVGQGGGASPTTIGIISVVFGAGYLLGARLLDRGGQPGAGVPFSFVGHIALPVGIVFLGDDLEALGAGIAFIVVGALVIWSGALGGRRATTVIGAAEIFVGIVLILGDVMEESSATSVGTAMFVIGALIVLAAQLLNSGTGETPQLTPGPSQFDVASGPRKEVRPSFAPMGGPPPGQPWPPGAYPSGPYPRPGPPTPPPGQPPGGPGPQQQPPAGPPPPPPPPPPGGGSF
jgi:hypothetical protein